MRPLDVNEIAKLEGAGCRADDWSRVSVVDPFIPENYRNAEFRGTVVLGRSDRAAKQEAPASSGVRCGVYNSVVSNVEIGDGCLIDRCYFVGANGKSSFGSGSVAEVMDETGGRKIRLVEGLSAQLAYMLVFYRNKALFGKRMDELAQAEAEGRESTIMHIGDNVSLLNCGTIENVRIYHSSTLEGVTRLTNGTVQSYATVLDGVIAENFIFQTGATVEAGAHIHNSLIGEEVKVSAATVHDSLIFSNSVVENGEIAASFLGPFSTTMHKSTLLIGGLFSFFNAGSGSNQSNHMYKLGPMHQGVTQRGCKTGSDSYILWPAAIGPFTTILGRHYNHPDTRDFPFSVLLNSQDGKQQSLLLPGAAAATVGFARDVEKWPKRDKRFDFTDNPLDIIDFSWLSPYTVAGCLRGLTCLKMLTLKEGWKKPALQGFGISLKGATRGIEIYNLLIDCYVAQVLTFKIKSKISVNPEFGVEEILEELRREVGEEGSGNWVDVAGLLAPKALIDKIMDDIAEDEISSCSEIQARLHQIDGTYYRLSWEWLRANFEALTGTAPEELTAEIVAELLEKGAEATERLSEMWQADAAKEFDPEKASLGFGVDSYGDEQEKLEDFTRSRGSLAGNQFLAMNQRNTKMKTAKMRMFAEVMKKKI